MIKYVLAVLLGTLGAVAFVGGIVYAYTHLPVPHPAEADPTITIQSLLYADDPAMLYQTVGIKECNHGVHYKKGGTRAVLLSSNDLVRVKPLLAYRFSGDVSAVLYVNTPESNAGAGGKPALVALQEEGTGHCVLGIAESWNPQLFSDLKARYQPLLNQQQ